MLVGGLHYRLRVGNMSHLPSIYICILVPMSYDPTLFMQVTEVPIGDVNQIMKEPGWKVQSS